MTEDASIKTVYQLQSCIGNARTMILYYENQIARSQIAIDQILSVCDSEPDAEPSTAVNHALHPTVVKVLHEVASGIYAGHNSDEVCISISRKLELSVSTVRNYLARIKKESGHAWYDHEKLKEWSVKLKL